MLLIVLAIVLVIALFIAINTKNFTRSWDFRIKSIFIAPLALLVIVFGMFTTVQANEVGIVYNIFGGLQEETLGEGLHVKAPWVQVYKISTKLREESFEMSAQTGIIFNSGGDATGGGQWVTYQVTLQYRVSTVDATKFYRTFGSNVVDIDVIEGLIKQSLQTNSVKYDVFSILKGQLVNVMNDTQDQLTNSMSSLGITVQAFIVRDVDAGAQIETVIVNEATAAKQIDIAEKEQAAAVIREETIRLQAEIEAKTVVIQATANAQAQQLLNSVTVNAINSMYEGQFGVITTVLVSDDPATTSIDEHAVSVAQINAEQAEIDQRKADFEALILADLLDNGAVDGTYGYLTIQEITDVVLRQLYYDTWDGILPQVVSGNDSLSIILPN